MVPYQSEPFGDLIVVGDEDAAFTGMNMLVVVEAVSANIRHRPGHLALVMGSRRLGGVGNHLKTVFSCDRHQSVHIGGVAKDIYRHDRLSVRRDVRLDRSGIQTKGIRLDIRKNRDCIPMQYRGRAGAHGPWRHNDFVARFDAHGADRGNQARGPGIDGDRVLHIEIRFAHALELFNLRAAVEVSVPRSQELRQHPAFNNCLSSLQFFSANWVISLERSGDSLAAPKNRQFVFAHLLPRSIKCISSSVRNAWLPSHRCACPPFNAFDNCSATCH